MAKMEPRCPGGTLKCCKLMKSEHSVLCINIISIPYMVIRYSAQCFLPMPYKTNINVKFWVPKFLIFINSIHGD